MILTLQIVCQPVLVQYSVMHNVTPPADIHTDNVHHTEVRHITSQATCEIKKYLQIYTVCSEVLREGIVNKDFCMT